MPTIVQAYALSVPEISKLAKGSLALRIRVISIHTLACAVLVMVPPSIEQCVMVPALLTIHLRGLVRLKILGLLERSFQVLLAGRSSIPRVPHHPRLLEEWNGIKSKNKNKNKNKPSQIGPEDVSLWVLELGDRSLI